MKSDCLKNYIFHKAKFFKTNLCMLGLDGLSPLNPIENNPLNPIKKNPLNPIEKNPLNPIKKNPLNQLS